MTSPKPDPARAFDSLAWRSFRATDPHAAALQHFIGAAIAFGTIYAVASPTGPPLMLDPRLRPETWTSNSGDLWDL